MKCTSCGNEIPEGSAFCTNCGAPAPQAVEAPPAPPAPAAPAAGPVVPPAAPTTAPPPLPAVQGPARSMTWLWVVLAVVGALAIAGILAAIIIPTVLNKDAGKAREAAKAGDLQLVALQNNGEDFFPKLNELLNGLATLQSASEYEKKADEVRGIMDDMESELEGAESEYQKVEPLSGVEKYKEYAKLTLALIAIDRKIVEETRSYLDFLGVQIKKIDAGQAVDSQANGEKLQKYVADMKDLGEQATAASKKAEEYKKENL